MVLEGKGVLRKWDIQIREKKHGRRMRKEIVDGGRVEGSQGKEGGSDT